jgi:predicted ribosome quality control (RQC) complex YloA/Tae2 family protein
MSKNGKSLSLEDVAVKRKDLEDDLAKVKDQLQNLEKMKVQLQAQGNALSGAIQQCDVFLTMLDEASPASSIPSQDDSAVETALS